MQKWQCRVAPSLGDGFAGDVYRTWGVDPYINRHAPTVFFGMYGLHDFQALWNHKGTRVILWCGSDIRNYLNDYWLDDSGTQRIKVTFPSDVNHYVENSLEQIALVSMGIVSDIIPSFLGNINDYPVQSIDPHPRYYTSVSGDDFALYGWDEIPDLARKNRSTEYHLYGNTVPWQTQHPNVFVHGRVSQEQMNEQTKTMTGALRLTRFDGASEILVKSTLWGQQPLSPYIYYDWLGDRDKLLTMINKFPWVSN